MLNVPLGDIASLRFVTTGKYISGWIHRYVVAPGQFPYPTNLGNCGVYYCSRGDVQGAPVAKDISNSNIERLFLRARPCWFTVRCLVHHRQLHVSTHRCDGYNNYQAPPNNEAIYQPYDIKEPYYDSFHMWSLKVSLRHVVRQSDLGVVLLEARCLSIDGFDRSPANIFNYTAFIPTSTRTTITWQLPRNCASRRGVKGTSSGWAACTIRTCTRATSRRIRRLVLLQRPYVFRRSARWATLSAANLFLYAPPNTGESRRHHVQRQQSEHPHAESDLRRGELQADAHPQTHGGLAVLQIHISNNANQRGSHGKR